MTDPLLFLLAVLTILGAPGPTNILLATGGATAGVTRSLSLVVAALLGYLVTILLVRALLSPMIAAWPVAGTVLKVLVATYVAWLAVKLWARPRMPTAALAVDFRMVLIATLLNPKAIIFALTVIPLTHPQLWLYFAAFAVAVVAVGFSWLLIGGAVGAAARGKHQTLIQRVAAVALGGFAGMILASALG
jgi:threonine/homoserine/homoserine lactone efflux protein